MSSGAAEIEPYTKMVLPSENDWYFRLCNSAALQICDWLGSRAISAHFSIATIIYAYQT